MKPALSEPGMPPEAAPADDARFMALALALGRRALGRAWPNPAVGALVVAPSPSGPVVVGRGWTQDGGRPHAETEALARAGARARGGTLYVTLEPCSHFGRTPPCVDAVLAAGIARVVTAIEDPDPRVSGRGHDILRRRGVAVTTGIGADEARIAHAGHIRRVRDGRPHVTLKLAVSTDSKVGAAGSKPVALTGPAANDRVHLMRAEADAILIGIGTALSDDPMLTCRLPGMAGRSPVRVVLDGELRLPPSSRLVRSAREVPVWVFTRTFAPADREAVLRDAGVEVFRVGDAGPGRLSAGEALSMLATLGITRVLAEGGPRVATFLLRADLVDEAHLITTPRELGADAVPALDRLPLSALTDHAVLTSTSSEMLGADRLRTFFRRED
jgi:diaminohydroxyphosphoribosylaminopyrimidine deaminase/5-amino-6-(5-phosphoribosylamino)uracil reductase